MKYLRLKLSLLAYFAALAAVASAQEDRNWNQFRGPKGDGESVSTNLPVEFSETENLRWKTPIHDKGWSSPVIWGNQIWLTTARDDGSELFAICVDLESGEIIHDIKVFDVAEPQVEYNDLNTRATPTPFVEAGRVYVHFGTYGTACLDTKTGKKIWERRDLNCDHRVRPGSSPVVDGDSLFLQYDGVDVQFAVALDKHTGETLWLKERGIESDLIAVLKAEGVDDAAARANAARLPNDNRKSYGTPTIIEFEGKRQLISPAAEVTFSYDPKTGEELWRLYHEGMGFNVSCRPILKDGILFLTTGQARRVVAVRPSGTGDITETHTVWSERGRVSEYSSPLIIGDLYFMISDRNGQVSCLDARSGERIWRERLPAPGTYWASPLYADGKIYFSNVKGTVSVIAAEREFRLLAENRFETSFTASPAVAGDALILRSETDLYCFAK